MSDVTFEEKHSLPTHVELCALRYRDLARRMSRVEYLLYGIIALLALGEGTILDVVRRLVLRP